MESEPGRAEGVQSFLGGRLLRSMTKMIKSSCKVAKKTKPKKPDNKDINRGFYLGEPGRVERVGCKQMQNLGAN